MSKWEKTRFPGVRYREHKTRKYGVKFDRYYSIRYQKDGKQKEEGLGWASKGWNETKANEKLAEVTQRIRNGQEIQTLKEMREHQERLKAEDEARKRKEEKDSLTFGEFYRKTYLPQAMQDNKPGAWKADMYYFKKWIDPIIGEKQMRGIITLDIERIKKKVLDSNRSPRTVVYVLGIIRHVFNEASRFGVYTGNNPVKGVNFPKFDNQRDRFLTEKEANDLLFELRYDLDAYGMTTLSLACGLRLGEVLNLTWDCVNFDNDDLFIKDAKFWKNRHLRMGNRVKEILRERLKTKRPEDDLVFPGQNKGKTYTSIPEAFTRSVKKLGLNIGVTDNRHKMSFHTLRHTYASWLAQRGRDIFEISKLLGHKDVTTTMRYAHLKPDYSIKSSEIIDSIIGRMDNIYDLSEKKVGR
jgi:integrase